MKELMEKGRNFINGEKEFKEKFQALVRKKEEKEKREREEDEWKAREEKENREKVMIEKENTKNSFSGVESDIDNILSSLENPCEDVLVEKSIFGVEPDIDINVSSIENTKECLTKKEEEETNKEEESFMTPSESIAEKESLKRDCNTLNSSFQLYSAHSSLQKTQKSNFVMLFPSLGNKQHKVNTNIFERGFMLFFKNNFKDKRPYFCLVFSCFSFLLTKKFISCLFDVYCRLTFDPGG